MGTSKFNSTEGRRGVRLIFFFLLGEEGEANLYAFIEIVKALIIDS